MRQTLVSNSNAPLSYLKMMVPAFEPHANCPGNHWPLYSPSSVHWSQACMPASGHRPRRLDVCKSITATLTQNSLMMQSCARLTALHKAKLHDWRE